MYSVTDSDRLDDALELAAPLNEGPPAPALSGAWAAIESLLYHPGDKDDPEGGRVVAADRLAALVVCSWPRAELTALSYRHRPPQPDDLSQALEATSTNVQRCREVARAVAGGASLALSKPSDVAACERMSKVLAEPRKELGDVRTVYCGVLRRLYRHRNIVNHGGTTAAVALDATLRTAAPLVGAGLDRMVHAALTLRVEPLDLAARAENSLALVTPARPAGYRAAGLTAPSPAVMQPAAVMPVGTASRLTSASAARTALSVACTEARLRRPALGRPGCSGRRSKHSIAHRRPGSAERGHRVEHRPGGLRVGACEHRAGVGQPDEPHDHPTPRRCPVLILVPGLGLGT